MRPFVGSYRRRTFQCTTRGVRRIIHPHHLKHGSAWTPTKASKDKPPAWISPSGRTYPSEHQDWEPPHWPNQDIPPDPGRDHDLELPQDPFPEWYQFTAAHALGNVNAA